MRRTRLARIAAAALAAAIACPLAASAQQGSIASTVDELVNEALTLEGKEGAPPPLAGGFETVTPEAAGQYREAALRFAPDPEVRANVIRGTLEGISQLDPAMSAELGKLDLFALLEEALAKYGMTTGDLADTSAVYLISLHDAVNLVPPGTDTPPAVAQAVSNQLARAYASMNVPELSDPATVQAQSDTYALQALLVTLIHQAIMDPSVPDADRQAYKQQMIETGQSQFGMDLSEVTINEAGMLPNETMDMALDALNTAVEDERAKRAAEDPQGEADRQVAAAFGTPCGQQPRDATERKILNLFEKRGFCQSYEPASYERFQAEVPAEQQFAINFLSWTMGNPLYPAAQAKTMDGMID